MFVLEGCHTANTILEDHARWCLFAMSHALSCCHPQHTTGWALDAVISQVKRADAAIQHATRLVDEGHHQEAVRATAEAQQLFEFAKNSAITWHYPLRPSSSYNLG